MRISLFLTLIALPSALFSQEPILSRDAQIWDRRQAEIDRTAKELSKVLRRNGRIVYKGIESNRVSTAIAQTIQAANRRLKNQGLYTLQSSPGKSEEKRFSLSGLDLQRILDAQEPVQREYSEESLKIKKEAGKFLHGRAYSLDSLPESLDQKVIFDLESFEPTESGPLNRILEDFMKRTGKRAYALLLPKVELSDGSYSASSRFTIEHLKSSGLRIFQERRKSRRADLLSIQVLSYAPRTLLIVSKGEFLSPLKEKESIQSIVITSFAEAS